MSGGTLYVVATPIGNLGDVTRRAVETLGACDVVLAEDTRRTRQLLTHLGIAGKEVQRFDAHASDADVERVVAAIRPKPAGVSSYSRPGVPSGPGWTAHTVTCPLFLSTSTRAVADASLIQSLKPGDVIEITYTRARAIAIEKQR